ncbi:YbdD/YjiX family protein [Antrihabitans spumae]|uniref:YbdD/YjiX family protein n=1 Tax=Antrihabitans spumae TaxID=3373370 RepID=A0ABW7KT85_9NOCA
MGGAVRSVLWWITSVMGDHDYARYVEYLRTHDPDADVPTERAFWRARYRQQDTNPGARCC